MIDPKALMEVEQNVQLLAGWSGGSKSNIRLRHHSSLHLAENVILYEAIRIFGWGHATIKIGKGTYLNPRSQIVAGADISIGEDCAIAWDVQIISDDIHVTSVEGIEATNRAPISIGNHVWIGANCTILKGAEIGDNCIVAAGSVVLKGTYESGSLIAGNPGRVVRTGMDWRDMTIEEKQANWADAPSK